MTTRLSPTNQEVANAFGLVHANDVATISVDLLGRMLDLAREQGRKEWATGKPAPVRSRIVQPMVAGSWMDPA